MKSKVKAFINKSIYSYKQAIKRESQETKEMLLTFKDLLHSQIGDKKEPTKDDIKAAIKQLKDVGKMTILTPLFFLPGSFITIPLLVKLGKRYGIDILPS